MALGIHALDEAVIEALLQALTRSCGSSRSFKSAHRQARSRAHARTVPTVGSSPHSGTEYGTDRRATHAAVSRRRIGRLSADLFAGELLADVVISAKLLEALT